MIVEIVILSVVFVVLCFDGAFCKNDKHRHKICLIELILLLVFAPLLAAYLKTTPTAMDVYRGETALQYTIRNNQVVDSIVIFK